MDFETTTCSVTLSGPSVTGRFLLKKKKKRKRSIFSLRGWERLRARRRRAGSEGLRTGAHQAPAAAAPRHTVAHLRCTVSFYIKVCSCSVIYSFVLTWLHPFLSVGGTLLLGFILQAELHSLSNGVNSKAEFSFFSSPQFCIIAAKSISFLFNPLVCAFTSPIHDTQSPA